MRPLLCSLAISMFFIAGNLHAQTHQNGHTTYDVLTPLWDSWKMAPPGNNAATIHIYPNPVADYLTISMPYMNIWPLTICLYDAAGKVAQRQVLEPGTSEYKIDVRTNANGTYFLKLNMHDVEVVRKVVLMTK